VPLNCQRGHLPIALDENGPTASSPEACQVAMSSNSFVVFDSSRQVHAQGFDI
jgi:hypothetical protein